MSFIQWLRSKSAAKPTAEKPVSPSDLEEELGYFCLRKGAMEGEIQWLGAPLSVSLYPEEKSPVDFTRSTDRLKTIAGDANEWDKRLKQFAADKMGTPQGTVAIWGNDDTGEAASELTKEAFMQRLSPGFLWVYPDGNLYFAYDTDGMFTDHGLGFYVDSQNVITDCHLEG